MRLFYLVIISVGISFSSLAQDSSEIKYVLDQFGLSETDHRGIILHFNESADNVKKIDSMNEALFDFLSSTEKRDLTHYFISSEEDKFGINGKPLDVMQIAQYYLLTKED